MKKGSMGWSVLRGGEGRGTVDWKKISRVFIKLSIHIYTLILDLFLTRSSVARNKNVYSLYNNNK